MKKLPLCLLLTIPLAIPLRASRIRLRSRRYNIPPYVSPSLTKNLIEHQPVDEYMKAFDCQETACINEQKIEKKRGKMLCFGYIKALEGILRINAPYVLKGLIFRFFDSLPPCKPHGRVLLFQTLDSLLHTTNPTTKELCAQKLKEVIKKYNIALTREGDKSKSVLHYCCKSGNLPLVNQCLESGAKVNITDISGISPLHTAILHHNKALIKPLITYGANINQKIIRKNEQDPFPLYLACDKIHSNTFREIALELLTYESLDVNLTYHGKSALFLVLEQVNNNQYMDVVKAFLAHKKLDLSSSYNGMTALEYAQEKKLAAVIPLIRQHSDQ